MSKRAELRALYIEGWNTMNAEKLVSAVADEFLFDDPADPEPVTKAALADYMPRWPERAKALGATFEFEMSDKVVQDRDGVLLEWHWWKLAGTATRKAWRSSRQPMTGWSTSDSPITRRRRTWLPTCPEIFHFYIMRVSMWLALESPHGISHNKASPPLGGGPCS